MVRRTVWVLLVIALPLLAPFASRAQAPENWFWSKDLKLSGEDLVQDVAMDTATSATYAVGSIEKSSGLLETLLHALLGALFPPQFGGADGTILKYDDTGALVAWGTVGGTGADRCNAVCTDPSGNVYVTGYFSGTSATFGPAPTLSSAGGKDLFVLCMDRNGTLLWKVRGGGANDDMGTGIAYRNGKVYVTGTFKGTATIAGTGSSTAVNTARTNAFVAAFDAASGTGLWRVDAGNANDCTSNGICADNDRVYVIGEFIGNSFQAYTATAALGSQLTTGTATRNGFVLALRNTGTLDWSVAVSDVNGTDNMYHAMGIDASPTAVFITGSSHNGTVFPGGLTVNAANGPHDHAYVARLNKNTGASTWVRTMRSPDGGTNHSQVGRDITVDRNGDVLVTGSFRKSMEFPNGSLIAGGSDLEVFLAKYSSTGTFKWAKAATGNQDDLSNGVSTNGKGKVSIGGSWQDEILFEQDHSGNGGSNIFVAQIADLDFEMAAYRDPSRWSGPGPICQSAGPLDLTTTYIPARAGSGIAVHASNSVDDPDAALGLAPGGEATFNANGDWAIIDLGSGNTIPAGEKVLLRWRRTNAGAGVADISVSSDGSLFSTPVPVSTLSLQHAVSPITVPSPARYIRIARTTGGTFTVDGVFYDLGTEPGGNWSGSGVSGTTFDPSALSGNVVLTYTVGTFATSRTIIVDPASVAGTISGAGTICPGSNTTLTLTGHSGNVITWSTSTDNGVTWSPNTTNDVQGILDNVTQQTLVRTTVTNGACPSATTPTVTVTPQDHVPPILTGGQTANITVGTDPGSDRATVTYALPTVTDNCSTGLAATAVVAGTAPGSTFPIGTTTVALRATDASGNATDRTFTITVIDTEKPRIICPAAVNVDAVAGTCSAPVTIPLPTATDNSGGTVTVVDVNGLATGPFTVGGTRVLFRATDLAGNTDTCSALVTVKDVEKPQITCPGNSTIHTAPGTCSAMVNVPGPVSISDNCMDQLRPYTSDGFDGVRGIGTYTFTHTVSDLSGNTSSCAFTISVVDTAAPVINCPADITVPAAAGSCSAIVNYSIPTATDNCGGTVNVVPTDLPSGTAFPVGNTTVHLKATDASGNSATCSFIVTVTDGTPPVIACPGDIEVDAPVDLCGATVTYVLPSATDNCGGTVTVVPVNAAQASGSTFPVGTTIVVLKATDAAGLTATCSFSIIVHDVGPPAMTCPADVTRNTDAGRCSAVVNYSMPTATDNCAGPVTVVALDAPANNDFPVGLSRVHFIATDGAGLTDTCSLAITVIDAEAPVITCPGDISVDTNDPTLCGAVVDYPAVTASDNCAGILTPTSNGPAPGSFFPIGTTIVTHSTTDGVQIRTCAFRVTVIDKAPPRFTLGTAPIIALLQNCTGTVPDLSGLVIDANDCSSPVSITQTPPAGSAITSSTTASITVSDALGNDTTVQVVLPVADRTPPVITCPPAITWTMPLGQCSAQVPIPRPLLSDDCSLVALIDSTAGIGSGSWFATGQHTVTYTAADGAHNMAQCSMQVTVSPHATVDLSYPVSGICSDAGMLAPDVHTPSGGSFSCTDAGLVIDASTGVIDPATSTPGTYVVRYAFSGACASFDEHTVSIAHRADAGTDGTLALCSTAAPVSLFAQLHGTPGPGGEWNSGTQPDLFDPSTTPSGTYTYSIDNGPLCPLSTATVTVTVDDQADAAFAYPRNAYCSTDEDAAPTVHEDGGVFTSSSGLAINGTNGTIDLSASAEGHYTVEHFISGACPGSSTFDLTIERRADAGSNGAVALCSSDASILLFDQLNGTPEAGGGWNDGTQTDLFDPSSMPSGLYTYSVGASAICPASTSSVTVTVAPRADAAFTYAQAAYCSSDADPLPTTVQIGGVFSGDNGLVIDATTGEVDLGASSAGPHTVKYLIAVACPDSSTFSFTIERRADAGSDGAITLCSSAPPFSLFAQLNGTPDAGGVWNNAAQPDEFDPATMPSGTYTYGFAATPHCPATTADVEVTVYQQASADLSYAAAAYCSADADPLPMVQQSGGSFAGDEGLVIDMASGLIDLDASVPGPHTISYTFNNACPVSNTFALSIDGSMEADAGDDIAVCGLLAALPSMSAGTWSGPPEVTVQPTLGLSASAPGIYALTLTRTNGVCVDKDTVIVTFDAMVTADGGEDVHACGLGATMGAVGSGHWSPVESVVIADLNDPLSAVSASAGGTYTLTWTVVSGACIATDQVPVTFDVVPIPDAGDDQVFCGTTGTLAASGDGTWTAPTGVMLGDVHDPLSSVTAVPGTFTLQWTVANGLCEATDTIDITFTSPPQAGTDGTITVCSDGSTIALDDALSGADAGGTWTTSTGAAHGTIYDPLVDVPGIFTYTVQGPAACPADAATVTVTELTAPNAGSDGMLTLCANAAATSLLTGLNGPSDANGTWAAPDGAAFTGLFDPAVHAPGIYTYTVSGIAPCSNASAQVTVSVTASPDASWPPPAPICSGSGLFDLTQLAPGGSWSGNGVTGTMFDPSSLNGDCPVLHTVTADGCTASANGTITVVVPPMAYAGADAMTCGLSFALQAGEGNGQWTAVEGGSFTSATDASTTVDVAQPGTYRFIRTVTNGTCSAADTVSIVFNTMDQLTEVSAGDDRVQNIHRSADLVGVATGATGTHWSIISGSGTIADPASLWTTVNDLGLGTNMILLGARAGACPMRTDTVVITVNDLLVPQGFSPNGDGVNDLFEVVGIDVFSSNSLSVFDRWGRPVYTANNYANQWDGRGDNGQELMDDTYFYVLKLNAESTHNGYIIIKR